MRSRSILLIVLVGLLAGGCLGISVERRAESYHGHPGDYAADRGFARIHDEVVTVTDARGSRAEVNVSYHNDTENTFSVVTVWCRALDEAGYQLGAQAWTLMQVSVGPMAPGFKARETMDIDLRVELPVHEVVCEVTGAR